MHYKYLCISVYRSKWGRHLSGISSNCSNFYFCIFSFFSLFFPHRQNHKTNYFILSIYLSCSPLFLLFYSSILTHKRWKLSGFKGLKYQINPKSVTLVLDFFIIGDSSLCLEAHHYIHYIILLCLTTIQISKMQIAKHWKDIKICIIMSQG